MTLKVAAADFFSDPSFADGFAPALCWESSAASGFAWSDDCANPGTHSLEILGDGGSGKRWFLKVPVKPERRYRFSCRLRAQDVPPEDGAFLAIAWTRNGAVIDNEWGYPRKQSADINSTEWTEVFLTSQSDGAEVDGAELSFVGPRQGTAWAADFAVEDVGVAVPHDSRWYSLEDDFFDLDNAAASAHIKWANPHAGRRLRVLFIYPIGAGREIVETAQRLDFDIALAPTAGYSADLGATLFYEQGDRRFSKEQVIRNLADKLEADYDIIVIGLIKWDILPETSRNKILEKVRNGTGLFYGYGPGYNSAFEKEILSQTVPVQHDLIDRIPWQHMPVFNEFTAAADIAAALYSSAMLGDGRVVVFRPARDDYEFIYQFMTPGAGNDTVVNPLYYEYCQAYLAHLLCWLSDNTTAVNIDSVDIRDTYPQSLVARSKAAVVINSMSAEVVDGSVTWTIRAAGNETLIAAAADTMPLTIAPGKQSVEVGLPFLETGRHFLELTIEVAGKTHDWRVGSFEVTGDRSVTGITLKSDQYVDGDTVTGTVSLSAAADGYEIRLQVTDSWDRLVHESKVPVNGLTKVPFNFDLELPRANLFHVTAELRRDDKTHSRAKTWFGCPTIDRREYKMGVWSGADNNHTVQLALSEFRNAGVDMLLAQIGAGHYPVSGFNLAKNNLQVLIYGSLYAYRYQGNSNIKPGHYCLTSEAFREKEGNDLKRITGYYRPFGIHGFCVGNDGAHSWSRTDACLSETCEADFREYLKARYESLEALNRVWKSDYTAWEDVHAVTLADAEKTGNYAPWVDHRMHGDEVFATAVTELSPQWVNAIAPDVPVGIDVVSPGTFWWHGNCAYRLAEDNAVWIPYRSVFNAKVMTSFAKTWGSRGVYAGGYNWETNTYQQRFLPWWILYNGFDSWIWFMGIHEVDSTNATPLLTAKLTPTAAYRTGAEEATEIKGGIGKLLINTPRKRAVIAVVVSQPAVYVNAIYPGSTDREYWGWLRTIEERGYALDFITARDLAEFSDKLRSYKVVCLPYLQSMSTEEIANVKRFVAAGGCVIADMLPGTFDEHAQPYKPWPFEDLFGLKLKDTPEPDSAEITVSASLAGSDIEEVLSQTGIDKGLVPVDGRVLAQTTAGSPALVYNEFGRGRAFYLSFFLPGCPTIAYEQIMFRILSHCGVRRELSLIDLEQNTERAYGQVSVWKADDVELYGVIPHFTISRDMDEYLADVYGIDENENGQEAVFTEPGHVYSVRDHQYFGWTDRIGINLKHGRAELFARLPYKIDGIDLLLDDSKGSFQPGDTVEFAVSLRADSARPATHCYHIELYDADNAICPWFTYNSMAVAGDCRGELPLALNAERGTWRLVAREVISGIQAERRFAVG